MAQLLYKDVNSQYNSNGLVEALPNQHAISNSLYNILMCPMGSRGFQPSYGAMLESYIFEPCDEITARKIEINYLSAIEQWEPRIRLKRLECRVTPNNMRNGYDVSLVYYIPALDRMADFLISVSNT